MNSFLIFKETMTLYAISGKNNSDYKIMLGKPVIKGTRITVELILRKLSKGASVKEICEMYSNIAEQDVLAALTYASEVITKEEVINLAS